MMTTSTVIFLTAALAHANDGSFVLKQLLLSRNRAVVGFTGALEKGTELIATFPNQKQCSLNVVVIKGSLATVDTSSCGLASDLVVGQKLELLLLPEEVGERPPNKSAQSSQYLDSSYRRELTDLQYQPTLGHLILSTDYTNTYSEGTLNRSSGGQVVDSNRGTQDGFSSFIGYGFTNEFAAGLQIGDISSSVTDYTYGPGSALNGQKESYKSNGTTDPILEMQYRAIEQDASPVTVDLILAYSPKLLDSTLPTASTAGNAARGGDLILVGADIGHKYTRASYLLGASISFFGPSSGTNPNTKVSTSYDPYRKSLVSAAGQFKISDIFLLRGQIAYNLFTSQTSTTSGLDTVVDSYSQITAGASFLGYFIPGKFAGTFGFSEDLPTTFTGKVGSIALNGKGVSAEFNLGLLAEF